MKLHTNLSERQAREALQAAKETGKVGDAVEFLVFSQAGSHTRDHAFEVQLGTREYARLPEGTVNQYGKPQKTRRRNQANTGFAATWHEWGWFMAQVFEREPGAVFGSRSWGYDGLTDFDEKTKYQFELGAA